MVVVWCIALMGTAHSTHPVHHRWTNVSFTTWLVLVATAVSMVCKTVYKVHDNTWPAGILHSPSPAASLHQMWFLSVGYGRVGAS